jgi:hypothetical protein
VKAKHKLGSTHRPRGTMCAKCRLGYANCSDLDFKHMPVIGKDKDGTVVVKCSKYERGVIL